MIRISSPNMADQRSYDDANANATVESTNASASAPFPPHFSNKTSDVWFRHSSGTRIDTVTLVAQSLAREYPGLHLTVAPPMNGLSLLGYAQAGHASCRPVAEKPGPSGAFAPVAHSLYVPPPRRLDGELGALAEKLSFGKFEYGWGGHDFVLYVADGRDGTQAYTATVTHYLLSAERAPAEALLLAAGSWANELHGEVWVFDQGRWQKSAELFRSVMGASWANVILDEGMKKAIIDDHVSFFESRGTYARLKVPWKRGVIYHGPPGNGKTISIKATMHMLYARKEPIPTLYVRSLSSVRTSECRYCLILLLRLEIN